MKNTLSDRLNYLTTIAEEQSITRAATRLFISQPALTAFLSRTEEELGTRLFDRTSTPIRITEAGAYYLSELEKICVMQDRLHQELADFSADDQELRLNVGIGRNRGSIWLYIGPEIAHFFGHRLGRNFVCGKTFSNYKIQESIYCADISEYSACLLV